MDTTTPQQRTLQYLRRHPRSTCIEIASGVGGLPFDEVCQALDELAQGGQINVVGFRSSLDLFEVAV
jgi:hypothetical protein